MFYILMMYPPKIILPPSKCSTRAPLFYVHRRINSKIMFLLRLALIVAFFIPQSLGYVEKHNSINDGVDAVYWFTDEFVLPKESYWSLPSGNSSIYHIYNNESYDESYGRQRKAKIPTKLSLRDKSWLASHNSRRKKYHSKYKSKYIPLKWSSALQKEADKWANQLIKRCGGNNLLMHDPKTGFGENLASGYGKELPSADSVLTRWVENEANDSKFA